MPDDENQPQNSIPEENSIPPSPQEPTEPASENTADSTTTEAPPETPESSQNTESAIPVNNDNLIKNEPEATVPESESSSEIPENPVSPQPQTAQIPVNEPLETRSKSSLVRQLLITARNAIQFRKRKKLDKILTLFAKQTKITNDEVEKYLHVSDATATRYLSILEKEGKIIQSGKTGKGVSYSKI